MAPRFSVITPIADPPPAVLREAIESVRGQAWPDWEWCIATDGCRPEIRAIVDDGSAADARIRVVHRAERGGIVAATNDALARAGGEFVAFLDHDDVLHRDALATVATVLDDDVDYVYTDEDKITVDGRHYDQFLKPDWSPDRFRCQMYTCHLGVFRRSVVEDVGGMRFGFDGSQDWDLVLRVTERARRVVHVPEILYHWRVVEGSAAADPSAKAYAIGGIL